jgi:hypothetical protein
MRAALPGKGVSLGKEAVLADSGREGEIVARVGRVRRLAFLSILREGSLAVLHDADHRKSHAQ